MLNQLDSQLILGIDPGYDRLGWAVAQKQNRQLNILGYGCIQTQKTADLFSRYLDLEQQLEKIMQQFHPQVAAIESLFFFKNAKTALKVSEARGIVLSKLINHQVKIFEYTPLQIKETVTGFGRADKKAVAKMIKLELNLETNKIIDDAVDALAVIMTHSIRSNNQQYYA